MTRPDANRPVDLQAIAQQAMLDAGFTPDFQPEVLQQAALAASFTPSPAPGQRDLRELLWSSIDNVTSRDLDQIEVAQRIGNEIRVSIGIADVDALMPKGSPADLHAAQNATSIYLGVRIFPMLPPEFSNDRTSLLQDQDRRAVVMEFTVSEDGQIGAADVSVASVRNRAKLNYEEVGAWLENNGAAPAAVAQNPALNDQLHLQSEAAERFHEERLRSGALEFESIEPQPVMAGQEITSLALQRKNRARDLIENLMVSTNTAMAKFLEARGIASIQRIVRTPERWPRIVELAKQYGTELPAIADAVALAKFLADRRRADAEHFPDLSVAIVKLIGAAEYVVVRDAHDVQGHFGLAVQDYTHSTAPNRRYPDLIIQRLLKAAITNAPTPYSVPELEQIALHCNERAAAARKVERLMRKVAAATFLEHRAGETFPGIVTGASPKGVFVRINHPPAEGRVIRGESGLDVGDKTRVRLLGTVPARGFIDFARVG